MSKQEVTYQEVFVFVNAARAYINDPVRGKLLTHFKYCLERCITDCMKVLQQHGKLLDDLRAKYAATEKIGEQDVLIKDPTSPGEYRMTSANTLLFTKERDELAEKKVKIEQRLANKIPDNVTEQERDIFAPFVMNRETDEQRERRLFPEGFDEGEKALAPVSLLANIGRDDT